MMKIKTLMPMRRMVVVLLAAAIFGLFQPGQLVAGQKGIFDNPKQPKMTARLNVGKLNYDAFCASCHGKTGRGTDKGPTFIHRVYHPGHHGDGSFLIAAKKGARAHHWGFGDMKPVKGVGDEQLAAIVEYVRAVQKANGLF